MDDIYINEPIFNNIGWLDTNGKYYGCPQYHHDEICAALGYGCEEDVEDLGWIKIFTPCAGGWYCLCSPTAAQLKWLYEHGCLTKADRIEYEDLI